MLLQRRVSDGDGVVADGVKSDRNGAPPECVFWCIAISARAESKIGDGVNTCANQPETTCRLLRDADLLVTSTSHVGLLFVERGINFENTVHTSWCDGDADPRWNEADAIPRCANNAPCVNGAMVNLHSSAVNGSRLGGRHNAAIFSRHKTEDHAFNVAVVLFFCRIVHDGSNCVDGGRQRCNAKFGFAGQSHDDVSKGLDGNGSWGLRCKIDGLCGASGGLSRRRRSSVVGG